MACTYIYQGKKYNAWEFADVLASMPIDDLMKYLPGAVAAQLSEATQASRFGRLSVDENGDPSQEEASFVENGISGKDPIGAADWLAANAPKQYAEIAVAVRDKLKSIADGGVKLGLSVTYPGGLAESQMSVARGGTFPFIKDGVLHIKVSVNGSGMTGRVGTSFRTVLHELAHAATIQAIRAGERQGSVNEQAVRDLYAVSQAILEHTRNLKNKTSLTDFERSLVEGRNNMLANVDEVVAWALSSHEAQAYLDSIPYKGKSLWTAFVEAIRRAFGLSNKNDTALSEVLRVSEILLKPGNPYAVLPDYLSSRQMIDQPKLGGQSFNGYDIETQQPGNGYVEANPGGISEVNWFDSSGNLPDTITIDGVERPTRNSNGQPIHPTEEGIRNFWKWFGDSQVVDLNDRPIDFGGFYIKRRANIISTKNRKYLSDSFNLGRSVKDGVASGRSLPDWFVKDDWDNRKLNHAKWVFYEVGRRGLEHPRMVIGMRYGKSPDVVSVNHADGVAEDGVSVVGYMGEDGDFGEYGGDVFSLMAMKGRGVHLVAGYEHPFRLGSDGEELVVYPADLGEYDPTQIKSATGNNGEFSASNPKINRSFAAQTDGQKSTVSASRDRLIEAFGKSLVTQLENIGLLNIAQTQLEAIDKAAADWVEKNGGDVDVVRRSLLSQVKRSVSADGVSVVMQSSEVGTDINNRHEFRVEVERIARARYAQKPPVPITVNSTNEVVFISWSSARHVLRDGTPSWQSALAVLHMEDLMRSAELVGTADDYKGRKDPSGAEFYRSDAEIDGVQYSVNITVRIHSDGRRYYDHVVVEKKNPAGLPESERNKGSNDAAPTPPYAGSEQSISQPTIDVKRSSDGQIQGFYVPGLGKSYLIADNVSANDMPAVMVHEIGVHAATDSTDKRIAEKMQALNQRAADLLENETGEFFDRVNQRLADAGETSNEEKAAYLLEEARKAKDSAPASVRQWIKDVVAAIKAWMFRNGMLGAGRLNQGDMLAVAEAYMRKAAAASNDANYQSASVNARTQERTVRAVNPGSPEPVRLNSEAGSGANTATIPSHVQYAAIKAAQKVQDESNAFDLNEEIKSVSENGEADLSSIGDDPRYWDSEKEEFTDEGFKRVDELVEEKARDNLRLLTITELSDLDHAYHKAQYKAMLEILDGMGIKYRDTSSNSSKYLEVGRFKLRFADHANTTRGVMNAERVSDTEKVTSLINVAPGDNTFSEALGAVLRESQAGFGAGIRFSKTGNTQAQPAQKPALPEETKSRAFQRKMQDKLNRFIVIKEWLAEQGIELSELADVHKAEERMHSRFANKAEDFREKRVKPLVEKIQKAGFSMDDVARFLHAQHAKERNDQIAKINKNLPDGGSGMTNAEAAAILAASSPELAALANELRSITVDTKNILLNAGLISKDVADAWDGAYQYYVPLKGGPDDEAGGNGTGKGLSVREKQRRALGHEKREDDTREDGEWIIENILADHERALMLAEKNRVFQSLLKMAVETAPLDLVTINKPEKRQILKNQASYVVRVKGRPVDSFTTKEAANLFKQSVALSQKGVSPADITIEKTYDQTVALMASPMPGPNEATGYINGQLVRVQFNDYLLARAYNNMGAESLGNILKAGRALNNYFSKIYTGYNPEFLLVNVIRDFQTGLANTTGEEGIGMAMKAAKNYTMRFRDLFRYARTGNETQWIKMYREDGGNTGAAYLSDLERLGSEIQTEYKAFQGVAANLQKGDYKGAARAAMRKVFDKTLVYIEHVNQAGENAMRLAVYQAMIESGRSRREAASLAKNVTVNFNRKGELGAQANALYLFFNAGAQGTAAVAHAHFKGKHRMQAWGFSSALLGLGYLMYLVAVGADEEEYEKTSEYERSRNILIPTGDGFFKIPVAYGYGFFWNLGRGMAEAQYTGDLGKTPWHIASSFVEEFTPFGATMAGDGPDSEQAMLYSMPTVAQIVGAPVFNRTSMGIPMMPSSFSEYAHARDLMNNGTRGTWADDLAGLLEDVGMDVSPETLKHYGRTFTGGSGMFASSVVDGAKLKWEGAELEASEIPFFRKLYTVPDVRGARARYYEAKSEAEKALADFKRAVKQGDMETANEIQAEQGELLALARLAANQKKRIKAARDRIDSIRLSGEYGKAAERHIIKNLEAEEAQIYDNYMAIFKARMGR